MALLLFSSFSFLLQSSTPSNPIGLGLFTCDDDNDDDDDDDYDDYDKVLPLLVITLIIDLPANKFEWNLRVDHFALGIKYVQNKIEYFLWIEYFYILLILALTDHFDIQDTIHETEK